MLKDTLVRITEDYIKREEEIEKQSSPLAGIFGFRFGPKYDSCHETYYNDMVAVVNEYLKGETDEHECFEAAEYVISAGALIQTNNTSHWAVISGQASIKPLIGLLTDEHKKALAETMDKHYPKRARVPLQDEIYKMLKR